MTEWDRRVARWRRAKQRAKRRALQVGAVLVGLTLLTQRYGYPLVLGTLSVLAAGGVFAAYQVRRWREARLMSADRPTVLYQHWFRVDLVQSYLDAGCPASWFGYTGITSRYDLRCGQHAKESWWWPLIDPALSQAQTWPNRRAALRAESRAIRERRGVGNTAGNPAFWQQAAVRRELQALAARIKYEEMAA